MTVSCPRFQTPFVAPRRRAQRTADTICGLAGPRQGVSSALAEAKDSGYPLNVIAGAVFGGLLEGTAAFAAGSAIFAPIDQTLPDKLRCQACCHIFRVDCSDPALP